MKENFFFFEVEPATPSRPLVENIISRQPGLASFPLSLPSAKNIPPTGYELLHRVEADGVVLPR